MLKLVPIKRLIVCFWHLCSACNVFQYDCDGCVCYFCFVSCYY